MVTGVADFRSFLGPQLKAVSGDAQASNVPSLLDYIISSIPACVLLIHMYLNRSSMASARFCNKLS